jgi:uncharacterized repeat protein (TIGR01451 family)
MVMKRFFSIFSIVFLLFCFNKEAISQCVSDAGAMPQSGLTSVCMGETLLLQATVGFLKDANDTLIYVLDDTPGPSLGNIIAQNSTPSFGFIWTTSPNVIYYVKALVGDAWPTTGVWYNDPCLSISNAVPVVFSLPDLIVQGCVLGCGNTNCQISASTTSPGAQFIWFDGSTGPVFSGSVNVPGSYSVTVVDASGCTNSNSAIVTFVGPVIQIQPIVTDASCFGSNDGSIQIVVAGGVAPYSISPSIQSLQNLSAGTYFITVTDNNGCSANSSIVVSQPPPIVISNDQTIINHATCSGQTNGSISIFPTGGDLPYSYNWTGPAGFVSMGNSSISNLIAGSYGVTVTDNNGCTSSEQFTINAINPNIQITQSIEPVTCFGDLDGKITLNVVGGTQPYTVIWSSSNIGITPIITVNGGIITLSNLNSGNYGIQVTDAIGCQQVAGPFLVPSLSSAITIPINSITVTQITCDGMNNGAISVSALGGNPPYVYSWSGPNGFILTGQSINGLLPGLYRVTATDINGCTGTLSSPIQIIAPPALSPISPSNFNVSPVSCEGQNNGTILFSYLGFANEPITYSWSGPNGFTSNGSQLVNIGAGDYYVTVTDANGCSISSTFPVKVHVSTNVSNCNKITGKINQDLNNNCLLDSNEPILAHWIVKATNTSNLQKFYGMTDALGNYKISVPIGNYTVEAIPLGVAWDLCGNGVSVDITTLIDSVSADFMAIAVNLCPDLTVDLSTSLLRRCFDNNYYHVNYCNNGTINATDAYIVITFDDDLIIQSSLLPYTILGNNQYRFEVGNIDIGDCRNFWVRVKVSCNASLGETHCSEAHIYPDGLCTPANPLWSGAEVRLSANCGTDSLHFTIKNTGIAPMSSNLEYIVIEDGVMLRMESMPPLGISDSVVVSFPSNGSTWRLEATQEANYPVASNPAIAVEGCTITNTFSTGYVQLFPQDDAAPWLDIDCTANIGSYDPNDKNGQPIGYSSAHYIRPNTDIEYLIRFQNTGTDTAFTVLVRDTLSQWLDPASIRAGASSHPYTLDLSGSGVLSFNFENILLPDSNTNEVASHGFLKYRISQKTTVPLETDILNRAAIFFDYNLPVMTNTTVHRVGENFLTLAHWLPEKPAYLVKIMPNPMQDVAILEIVGLKNVEDLTLKIFDQFGTLQREMPSDGGQFLVQKEGLFSGFYFFKIERKGKILGNGKLMVF